MPGGRKRFSHFVLLGFFFSLNGENKTKKDLVVTNRFWSRFVFRPFFLFCLFYLCFLHPPTVNLPITLLRHSAVLSVPAMLHDYAPLVPTTIVTATTTTTTFYIASSQANEVKVRVKCFQQYSRQFSIFLGFFFVFLYFCFCCCCWLLLAY